MSTDDLGRLFAIATVIVSACGFIFFGARGFLKPDSVAGTLKLTFADASAATAIRSIYGGFQVGLGLYLPIETFIFQRLDSALVALACIGASLTVSRAYGIWIDKGENGSQRLYLGLDVAMLVSALAGLWMR